MSNPPPSYFGPTVFPKIGALYRLRVKAANVEPLVEDAQRYLSEGSVVMALGQDAPGPENWRWWKVLYDEKICTIHVHYLDGTKVVDENDNNE